MKKYCPSCGATLRDGKCDNIMCGGENPYRLGDEPTSLHNAVPSGSVAARLGAYMVDVLPILVIVTALFYCFLGFDVTVAEYLKTRDRDLEVKANFLIQRNQIRDTSFLVYLLYCSFIECTSCQATLGKRLCGIRVTDTQGRKISLLRSLGRNLAKVVSAIPCGLGFLWAVFSKHNLTWHDMLSKTRVIDAEMG